MIPILFPPNEMLYQNNGIGRLSEAVECTVTEERNGIYELAMTYPVAGIHFEDIQLGCQILAKPSDTMRSQPFEIVNIRKTLESTIEIVADHISYRMSFIPVKTVSNSSYITAGAAIDAIKAKIVGTCPFSVSTDKADKAIFHLDEPASLKSVLYGKEGSLLDMYGGTWEFDWYSAVLRGKRGQDTGIVIRYGKDLTELKYEESREGIYTGVLPYWRGTVGSGDNAQDVVVVADTPVTSAFENKLPYPRNIVLDVTSDFAQGEFTDQPSKAQVTAKGKAYVDKNVTETESVNIDVSFAQLWDGTTQPPLIGLCDELTVIHGPMEIMYSGRIVKTEYDVLRDRYKSLEIGLLKPKLSDVLIAGGINK